MHRILLTALTMILAADAAGADEWPQWMGPQRDNVCAKTD